MKTSLVLIVLLLAFASTSAGAMKCPPVKPKEPEVPDGEVRDGEIRDGEIRDGEVFLAPNPCEPPDGEMIVIVPPNPEDVRCHEILTLLSADDASVDNVCDVETIDGELIYHFHFYYRTPFVFDEECLTHLVDFEGKDIPKGTAAIWEYTFDGVHILFSIPHLDLDTNGCNKIVEADRYIWQCNLGLHIWYKGFEQYDYQFVMTSYLSRHYIDILHVTISKNIVIGDCCLNELKIETELAFCSDMTCGTYLPEPLVIVRKDIFYVEHRITTLGFQHYYLHNVQLKIGEFFPVIISKNSSLQGRIRWELQVNVAMDGMVVESIVQIDDVAETARRSLAKKLSKDEEQRQGDVIGDNYLVKGQSGRIIVSDAESEYQAKQLRKHVKKENHLQSVVIAISVFLGLVLAGIAMYCIRLRIKKQNNYDRPSSVGIHQ